jgi:Sigma-70, region 4
MKHKMQLVEESGFDVPNQKPIRTWRRRSAANAVRSLDKVADMLGLSRQRVHAIEASAIKKLRHAFIREMPSLELRKDEYDRVCGLTETDFDSPA